MSHPTLKTNSNENTLDLANKDEREWVSEDITIVNSSILDLAGRATIS